LLQRATRTFTKNPLRRSTSHFLARVSSSRLIAEALTPPRVLVSPFADLVPSPSPDALRAEARRSFESGNSQHARQAVRASPPKRRMFARLALACLALLAAFTTVAGVGEYDPCYASKAASSKGDLFTFGIAYYPGGDVDAWDGIDPCASQGITNLTAAGAAAAVYRVKVDDMSFMRSTSADETAIMKAAGASLMTVVAYAANGAGITVRSDPRRIRAETATASAASAARGRVNALTLIARFDVGRLKYLQWHDMACRGCASGDTCFDVGSGHGACAGTEVDCGCVGGATNGCVLDVADPGDALRCHLTVAAAFSGNDAHKVPLTSFSQIERLGQYSVSGAAKGAGVAAAGMFPV